MEDLENSSDEIITASLIVIGDEILSGRTKDKNIGYLADQLTAVGIRLQEVRIVSDVEEHIIEAVNALRPRNTYVFTTGGIGPTHDDITADSVAKAFGVGIDVDSRAVEMMRKRYGDEQLNESRLRMARIPFGADLVANPISHTPGFKLENVIVMAGVPNVMQVMLDAVMPELKKGKQMLSATIEVNAPEGDLAEGLKKVQGDFPDVSMGSYPFFKDGKWGSNLVLRHTSENRLDTARKALITELTNQGLL